MRQIQIRKILQTSRFIVPTAKCRDSAMNKMVNKMNKMAKWVKVVKGYKFSVIR